MAKKYERILIIGAGGGREHALAWKIKQSPKERFAGELFFARGNAGTAELGTNLDIKETDILPLLDFARHNNVDLVLVVSDDPLAAGVVDDFRRLGFRTWGPKKNAAELEWSKSFAKSFMVRHKIPTARYQAFTDFESAKKYIKKEKYPLAVKVSGLALGKGVTIAADYGEAEKALIKIFIDRAFGDAGNEVVIEEFLEGVEISAHAVSDGKNFKLFPLSQDHKRIFEGNSGPNTGGMGTIAPFGFVAPDTIDEIENKIIKPTIRGMWKEGTPFVGLLYPGIMLTNEGPKVFEFNTRFGDPETQSYMRLLETDLLDIIDASIDGTLHKINIKWKDGFACNIALASAGYPGNYEKGKEIKIGKLENDIVIFHAGTTAVKDPEHWFKNKLLTNGGRVLGVSATGETLHSTLEKAYKAIEHIDFEGMQYRKDIGKYSAF